jgi:hypothetical protein
MRRFAVPAIWLVLGLGVAIGLVIGLTVGVSLRSLTERPEVVKPPHLAGQSVPANFLAMDFSKRHDLHCGDRVYPRCKILGFTGREKGEPSGLGSGSYRSGEYFDNWLVLEREDGRIVYIPPHSVSSIEVSAP